MIVFPVRLPPGVFSITGQPEQLCSGLACPHSWAPPLGLHLPRWFSFPATLFCKRTGSEDSDTLLDSLRKCSVDNVAFGSLGTRGSHGRGLPPGPLPQSSLSFKIPLEVPRTLSPRSDGGTLFACPSPTGVCALPGQTPWIHACISGAWSAISWWGQRPRFCLNFDLFYLQQPCFLNQNLENEDKKLNSIWWPI